MNLDVTSVNKQPEPYGQAPAAIDVITNDEIRRSGSSNLPEALRLADNLEVAQISSDEWAISARGFNANLGDKLLVLMDGRTLYTPLYGGMIWGAQDYLLEDIDRIEVISGPGGTMWGANAVNGVINITSKDAKDTQGIYVETGGGTQLQDFIAARYGGSLSPDVYYRFYAKYSNEDADNFSDGTGSAQDSWNRGQAGFRMDDEAGSQDHFTLQGDIYDSGVSVGAAGEEDLSGENVLGRWTHTISDDSDMSLQTYFDREYLSDPFVAISAIPGFTSGFPAGALTDDLYTYDLDFQHRFRLEENNKFMWGLGYRFTREIDEDVSDVQFQPPALDRNLFTGFAQDEIEIWERVYLTAGSKIEHNDYTGYEFEPSGRLKWDITDQQMLWAAVSRAVRTPSRYDTDLVVPSHITYSPPTPFYFSPNYLEGSSDFISETVIAYELGYRAQLNPKVSSSLSLFFNNYDNLQSTSPTPPDYYYGYNLNLTAPAPYFFQNNLEGQTYGVEFTTDYQIMDWWRLHGGYDYLHEDIWVKPGQVDMDDGLGQTADPQNQVFLRSSMDLPQNVQLDLDGRWIDSIQLVQSPTDGPALGTVPAYAEMDARLGWQALKNIEISLVGQNLLHPYHVEYGYPGSMQEEIPRSVYGKISCQF